MDTPDPLLQFFKYGHLPEHLRAVSQKFSFLAQALVTELPRNPERTVALRKLLEAKDCAVRAVLFEGPHANSLTLARGDGENKLSTAVVFEGFPELAPPVRVARAEDGTITVTDANPFPPAETLSKEAPRG
jgi:hypothetical protein